MKQRARCCAASPRPCQPPRADAAAGAWPLGPDACQLVVVVGRHVCGTNARNAMGDATQGQATPVPPPPPGPAHARQLPTLYGQPCCWCNRQASAHTHIAKVHRSQAAPGDARKRPCCGCLLPLGTTRVRPTNSEATRVVPMSSTQGDWRHRSKATAKGACDQKRVQQHMGRWPCSRTFKPHLGSRAASCDHTCAKTSFW